MVFTSNRVRVGVVSGVIRAMEEEEEEESRCFQIVGVGSRSGRTNESQCSFAASACDFDKTSFHLIVIDRVVSGIRMLFSLNGEALCF